MAKKKNINLLACIFAGIVLVGLVLVIVGMCVTVASTDSQIAAAGKFDKLGLFGEGWDNLAEFGKTFKVDVPSPAFSIVAFIIGIIGAALLLVHSVLKALGKEIKFFGFIAAGVTLVGAILVLIAGLVLVGSINDFVSAGGNLKTIEYSAGAGIWLGFIGGLLAAVIGILSSLKMFNK